MNRLVCQDGKISKTICTIGDSVYSDIIDFKWTIAISDKLSNFHIQAHTNQKDNPFICIGGADCQLEYENSFGIWKVESDGTPFGTKVLINGTPIPEMKIQVLEIVGAKGKVTLNIIAYGLSASIQSSSSTSYIKAGEITLGAIKGITIKSNSGESLNEFELTIEDNDANI